MTRTPLLVLTQRSVVGLFPAYGRVAWNPDMETWECHSCGTALKRLHDNDSRFCLGCGRLMLDPEDDFDQNDPSKEWNIFDHSLAEADALYCELMTLAGHQARTQTKR